MAVAQTFAFSSLDLHFVKYPLQNDKTPMAKLYKQYCIR